MVSWWVRGFRVFDVAYLINVKIYDTHYLFGLIQLKIQNTISNCNESMVINSTMGNGIISVMCQQTYISRLQHAAASG